MLKGGYRRAGVLRGWYRAASVPRSRYSRSEGQFAIPADLRFLLNPFGTAWTFSQTSSFGYPSRVGCLGQRPKESDQRGRKKRDQEEENRTQTLPLGIEGYESRENQSQQEIGPEIHL